MIHDIKSRKIQFTNFIMEVIFVISLLVNTTQDAVALNTYPKYLLTYLPFCFYHFQIMLKHQSNYTRTYTTATDSQISRGYLLKLMTIKIGRIKILIIKTQKIQSFLKIFIKISVKQSCRKKFFFYSNLSRVVTAYYHPKSFF